ncbi:MAG: 3-dehydroquinate synthase [Anaerolineae bacterium]
MKHIFLYGPPGAGKTVVGKALAARLGLPFTDLDALIEADAGRTIAQIFAQEGEEAFRERESAALSAAVHGEEGVIALGGGSLLRAANRALAERSGVILLLSASLETLQERLVDGGTSRPLLAGEVSEKLVHLLAARKEHYASFPLRLEVNGKSVEQLVRQAQVATGRFRVRGMGEYEVRVEAGGLGQIGEMLGRMGLRSPLIVSDRHVAPLYSQSVAQSLRGAGLEAQTLVLPAGEAHKSLQSVQRLWQGFLQAGLDRHSTILALGGGVIGDLAGFAAATFMRGMPWVNLPTTLLAMADASLGGKTGFDLPEGKNLIGAFHPPKLVLADPQVLATLPESEFRAGMAEIVKHGVIADAELFALCRQGLETVRAQMAWVIGAAMAVKIEIIEADPFERGQRVFLNFGHTIGHAIEQASGFRLRHGEAVAIGMVVEARLAEQLGLAEHGLAESIEKTLLALDLPVNVPAGIRRMDILSAMQVDKKKEGRIYRFALPRHIGQMELVELENLDIVLQEVR